MRLLASALPLALTLLPRVPYAPRMAASTSDAAIDIDSFDVWAGSTPLILDVNWRIMPNERCVLPRVNLFGSCITHGCRPRARKESWKASRASAPTNAHTCPQ